MKNKTNKRLKKSFKILGIVLLSILTFLILYCLAAISLSRIPVNKNAKSDPDIEMYILSNGVHTDIVLPLRSTAIDWTQYFKFEHTRAADTTAAWIAFGWGDKGFYLDTPTWAELKLSTAFNAAFALSTSAIHATFYGEMKESDTCKKLMISHLQYHNLIQFLKGSLEWDEENQIKYIETDARYSDHDAFYEATRTYNLFYTCNTWANNALKSCGQKACLWTPYDKGIFYHYR